MGWRRVQGEGRQQNPLRSRGSPVWGGTLRSSPEHVGSLPHRNWGKVERPSQMGPSLGLPVVVSQEHPHSWCETFSLILDPFPEISCLYQGEG